MTDTVKYEWLTLVCNIIGWVYFAAWSISFYPQAWTNFKRKCVIGLSFDYQIYNFTGFLFYSIYTLSKYIHNENNPNNPIAINDIAFAVHAFVLTCVVIFQIFIYERGDQKPSKFAKIFAGILWLIAIYNFILTYFFDDLPWFGPLSTIEWLGYVKTGVTCVKYIPQAWMNCRDKSTTGWAINNVILDFTGGSLSILQQCLSAYNTNDWGFVTDNIPKFLLGLESIIFDTIFMIQHYCLFGDNDSILRRPPDRSNGSFFGETGRSFDYARTTPTDGNNNKKGKKKDKLNYATIKYVSDKDDDDINNNNNSMTHYDVIIKMDKTDNNKNKNKIVQGYTNINEISQTSNNNSNNESEIFDPETNRYRSPSERDHLIAKIISNNSNNSRYNNQGLPPPSRSIGNVNDDDEVHINMNRNDNTRESNSIIHNTESMSSTTPYHESDSDIMQGMPNTVGNPLPAPPPRINKNNSNNINEQVDIPPLMSSVTGTSTPTNVSISAMNDSFMGISRDEPWGLSQSVMTASPQDKNGNDSNSQIQPLLKK